MNVTHVRVGDVVRLERRAVTVNPRETYQEVGVRSFGKGIFHKEPVSGAEIGTKRIFRIESGDLVFSNVFAWEGAVALATDAEQGFVGSHRFMTYVALDPGAVDVRYLLYLFTSEMGVALLRKASPGSAGRNRTLAIDRFESIELALPDVAEQRRIVTWLNGLLNRQRAALSVIEAQSADVLLRGLPLLVEAELQNAAKGVATVSDLVKIVSDVVHPGEDLGAARQFVGLQHVESHTGRRLGADPIGNEKGRKFRFAPGDIVYGYLRPYLNKAWVADRDGLCSVDQYVLRPLGRMSSSLIGYVLRSGGVLEQARLLTHNLQLPRLRSGLLMAMTAPDIPLGQQAEMESRLSELSNRVCAIAGARRRQREAVDALGRAALNRAFAGIMS